MEMNKFNNMLEIDILRNSPQKNWVSWLVIFKGLDVQKDNSDALLAKTMAFWHLFTVNNYLKGQNSSYGNMNSIHGNAWETH